MVEYLKNSWGIRAMTEEESSVFDREYSGHVLSWALVRMGDSPKMCADDGENERVIERVSGFVSRPTLWQYINSNP
jgi:hypothetical protein